MKKIIILTISLFLLAASYYLIIFSYDFNKSLDIYVSSQSLDEWSGICLMNNYPIVYNCMVNICDDDSSDWSSCIADWEWQHSAPFCNNNVVDYNYCNVDGNSYSASNLCVDKNLEELDGLFEGNICTWSSCSCDNISDIELPVNSPINASCPYSPPYNYNIINNSNSGYFSDTPSVCTINNSTGQITVLSSGTCRIFRRIYIDRNQGFEEADESLNFFRCSNQFNIIKASQTKPTLSHSCNNLVWGDNCILTASGDESTGSYQFQVAGGCTNSQNGNQITISRNDPGECTVKVMKQGDDDYNNSDWSEQETIPFSKKNQDKPDAPTLNNKTNNTITLNTINNGQYRCSGGACLELSSYQNNSSFSGLNSDTQYCFKQRYREDSFYFASDSSEEDCFYTLEDDDENNLCINPWEGTTAHGAEVTGYISPVECGDCPEITLRCNDGDWSGDWGEYNSGSCDSNSCNPDANWVCSDTRACYEQKTTYTCQNNYCIENKEFQINNSCDILCDDNQECSNGSCVDIEPDSCSSPCGGEVSHGNEETCYLRCSDDSQTETCRAGSWLNDFGDGYIYSSADQGCNSCQAALKTWLNHCSANFSIVNHGQSQTAYNIISGYTGSATFTCNDGDWDFINGTCNEDNNNSIFPCGAEISTFYNEDPVTYGTVEKYYNIGGNYTRLCWLDRNLGATRVPTSVTDNQGYGDLFQWGRCDDGHQKRDSAQTPVLANNTDTPYTCGETGGKFITHSSSPYDWRSPQNHNLWQGVTGTNNPCPEGWRLPSEAELNAERTSWGSNNSTGAYGSTLKWPVAGFCNRNGILFGVGSRGGIWSSTVSSIYSRLLSLSSSGAHIASHYRAHGYSVRCVQELPLPTFNLTYNSDDGGYVEGDNSQQVEYGQDGTPVEAIANSGYVFLQWSDGLTENPRKDEDVKENISLTAEFEQRNQHTLIYSTSGCPIAEIEGDRVQYVYDGGGGTEVKALAPPGCSFENWSDGNEDLIRLDDNITEDKNYTASFSIDNTYLFNLKYNASNGGKIIGQADQQVSPGSSGEEVKAQPDPGFIFTTWNDGVQDKKRTDSNIWSDKTFTSEFSFDYSHHIISPITDTRERDLIAVRVLPNPNNYSIETWYRKQGFTGSPQSLVVDGYQAIRDGRTVYVNAANVSNPDTNNKLLYTNIYLISYNQDPDIKTVDILARIINSWQFNRNLLNHTGYCNIASQRCASDSDCAGDLICRTEEFEEEGTDLRCRIPEHVNLVCLNDSQCPSGIYCNSLKAVVTRDVKRLGILTDIRESLENYQNINNNYPILDSGTYVRYNTLSVWPSWQQLFLPQIGLSNKYDPINALGDCEDSTYDPVTCWDENDSSFFRIVDNKLILPPDSFAIQYSTNSSGSSYDLCAVLESLSYEYNNAEGNLGNDSCLEPVFIDFEGPSLDSYNLRGSAKQEFSGFIRVNNPSGHPLTWNLTASSGSGWSAAPVLQDTSSPNQKRVWAEMAGDVGVYPIRLEVIDSMNNSFSENLDIEISGSVPFIEIPNIEYYLNPYIPLEFSVKITDPYIPSLQSINSGLSGVSNYTQNLISDTLFVNFEQIVTGDFLEDQVFQGTVTALNGIGESTTKNFNINLKVTRPILDFACLHQARFGLEYECFLGWRRQGVFNIDYSANNLPNGLSIERYYYGSDNNFNCGQEISHLNESYSTVLIGDQCWFAENLNAGVMINSNEDQTNQNLIEKYCYENEEVSCQLYGGLYQQQQAMNPALCPENWRVATDSDFKNLERFLTMKESEVNYSGPLYRGTNQGKALKKGEDFGGENSYGFNLINSGTLNNNGNFTKEFTSIFSSNNFQRIFNENEDGIARLSINHNSKAAFSVRCVKKDYWVLKGEPNNNNDIGENFEIEITALNDYSTQNTRKFNLEVNSYCGDGVIQKPNTEGRGGFYNDGNEDCDWDAGTTNDPEESSINKQYGCSMGENEQRMTPYPIVSGNYCVFKAPLLGGGYCGDGLCQTDFENSENCPEDC